MGVPSVSDTTQRREGSGRIYRLPAGPRPGRAEHRELTSDVPDDDALVAQRAGAGRGEEIGEGRFARSRRTGKHPATPLCQDAGSMQEDTAFSGKPGDETDFGEWIEHVYRSPAELPPLPGRSPTEPHRTTGEISRELCAASEGEGLGIDALEHIAIAGFIELPQPVTRIKKESVERDLWQLPHNVDRQIDVGRRFGRRLERLEWLERPMPGGIVSGLPQP